MQVTTITSPLPTTTGAAPASALAPPSVNAETFNPNTATGGEAQGEGPIEGGPQPVTAGDAIMQAAEGGAAEKQVRL